MFIATMPSSPCNFWPTSTSNNSCKRSFAFIVTQFNSPFAKQHFIPSFHVSTPTNTIYHTIKQGQNNNWTTQISTRAKLKIKTQNSSYTIHNWCPSQSTK
jgi:hypothetical protein